MRVALGASVAAVALAGVSIAAATDLLQSNPTRQARDVPGEEELLASALAALPNRDVIVASVDDPPADWPIDDPGVNPRWVTFEATADDEATATRLAWEAMLATGVVQVGLASRGERVVGHSIRIVGLKVRSGSVTARWLLSRRTAVSPRLALRFWSRS
jgi:hypothetical protein